MKIWAVFFFFLFSFSTAFANQKTSHSEQTQQKGSQASESQSKYFVGCSATFIFFGGAAGCEADYKVHPSFAFGVAYEQSSVVNSEVKNFMGTASVFPMRGSFLIQARLGYGEVSTEVVTAGNGKKLKQPNGGAPSLGFDFGNRWKLFQSGATLGLKYIGINAVGDDFVAFQLFGAQLGYQF